MTILLALETDCDETYLKTWIIEFLSVHKVNIIYSRYDYRWAVSKTAIIENDKSIADLLNI